MERIINVSVSLTKGVRHTETNLVQGDNTTFLNFKFIDDVLLDGNVLWLNCIRPDNSVVVTNVNLSSNEAKVAVPGNAFQIPGELKIEVTLKDLAGNKILSVNDILRFRILPSIRFKDFPIVPGAGIVGIFDKLLAERIAALDRTYQESMKNIDNLAKEKIKDIEQYALGWESGGDGLQKGSGFGTLTGSNTAFDLEKLVNGIRDTLTVRNIVVHKERDDSSPSLETSKDSVEVVTSVAVEKETETSSPNLITILNKEEY